ncbi:MAG: hypothetical protein FWH46_00980 [Methanimicrococcus sp.]|nr:hypothetical protein [Methanimicrococcus sp.]
MSTFDKEYFFILQPDDERLPYLEPDMDTAAKWYSSEVLPEGEKPLIFFDGFSEEKKENNIIPISPPPDVLFDAYDLLVCSRIADKLRTFEIPNLAIQPAIFIDQKDEWHENYWFLTFTEEFDCWDREASAYDPEPIDTEPPLYSIYTYALNESLLQKTPLSKRRLFKMGWSLDPYIVAHKSIVSLFCVKGVDIVPISDYGVSYP